MTQPASQTELLQKARIIAAALLLAVLTFLGIVVFLVHVSGFDATDSNLLSVIAAVLAVVHVAGAQVLPLVMKPAENVTLAAFWQQRLIIRLAVLEGACILLLVAYLLEQHTWVLAVFAAVYVIMVTYFPTASQLSQFIETREAFGNERSADGT